jgi:MerR family mercuric resistance operon transcriptional regulator
MSMPATLDLEPRYKVKRRIAGMRIGEVADTAGVSAQTVRFYERRGLLPQPQRGSNGYREYDDATLTALAFIRNGQAAGLTLVEIGTVLDLRRDGATPCGHVHDLLATKLLDVQRRQGELAALEAELDHLLHRSEQLDPADCTDEAVCHIITAK